MFYREKKLTSHNSILGLFAIKYYLEFVLIEIKTISIKNSIIGRNGVLVYLIVSGVKPDIKHIRRVER